MRRIPIGRFFLGAAVLFLFTRCASRPVRPMDVSPKDCNGAHTHFIHVSTDGSVDCEDAHISKDWKDTIVWTADQDGLNIDFHGDSPFLSVTCAGNMCVSGQIVKPHGSHKYKYTASFARTSADPNVIIDK